jgi:demethylmenaquinone methyltransferase/2-methoxy-6-polyprenyl-1,4-benzoquinol methylase
VNEEKVFCGDKKVSMTEKFSLVNKIFSSVHKNYDLMNNLMSFGLHHLWKEKFVSMMNQCLMFKEKALILDVASGTGDIALKFLSQRNCKHQIIVSDVNEDMLSIARAKLVDNNLFQNAEFIIIDATDVCLKDSSIDLYTISFGIRNVNNLQKALEEAYRVLKSNSYFLCMEFSPVDNSNTIFSKLYNIYSNNMIPLFGKFIAKDEKAYRYLIESIKTFPKKEEFKQLIENVGFKNIRYIELNCGLVTIHLGQKI